MRIAIISAYHKEPLNIIERCVNSVRNQTYACTHILVGDGVNRPEIASMGVQHISLPVAHADFGDTPRLIGAVSAYSQGFDALCWLDSDNWFEPDHVESCMNLAIANNSEVVTATRNLYRPDGTFLDVCRESDGVYFNDTNCYFITRKVMATSVAWGFKDKALSVVGDRYVWNAIQQHCPARSHNPKPTVNYETLVSVHYTGRNETPPINAKIIVMRQGHSPVSMLYTDFLELIKTL